MARSKKNTTAEVLNRVALDFEGEAECDRMRKGMINNVLSKHRYEARAVVWDTAAAYLRTIIEGLK